MILARITLLKKAETVFKNQNNFKIFNNEKKGLGGAINLGITKCNGNNIAIMMADLSDDIEDLKIQFHNERKKS